MIKMKECIKTASSVAVNDLCLRRGPDRSRLICGVYGSIASPPLLLLPRVAVVIRDGASEVAPAPRRWAAVMTLMATVTSAVSDAPDASADQLLCF